MMVKDYSGEDLAEIRFWKNSPMERPGDELSLENITNKMDEAGALLEKLRIYEELFINARTVLELGGGQCWASCIIKKRFPHLVIHGTDIAREALDSCRHWESIFDVTLDDTFPCRSHEIPAGNKTYDLVIAFAAAHHFRRHRKTLSEIKRVLKPGGTALYLYEPACASFWYKQNYARINRSRPEVPEDYILFPKLESIAKEIGFKVKTHPRLAARDSDIIKRVYYMILNKSYYSRFILPRQNVDMEFVC